MGSTVSYFINKNKQVTNSSDNNISVSNNNVDIEEKHILSYEEIINDMITKVDLKDVNITINSIEEKLNKLNLNIEDTNNLFKDNQQNIINMYNNVLKYNIELMNKTAKLFNIGEENIDEFLNKTNIDDYKEIYDEFILLSKRYNYDIVDVETQLKDNFNSIVSVIIVNLDLIKDIVNKNETTINELIVNCDSYNEMKKIIDDDSYDLMNFDLNEYYYKNETIFNDILSESKQEQEELNNIVIVENMDINEALDKIIYVFGLFYDLNDDLVIVETTVKLFNINYNLLLVYLDEENYLKTINENLDNYNTFIDNISANLNNYNNTYNNNINSLNNLLSNETLYSILNNDEIELIKKYSDTSVPEFIEKYNEINNVITVFVTKIEELKTINNYNDYFTLYEELKLILNNINNLYDNINNINNQLTLSYNNILEQISSLINVSNLNEKMKQESIKNIINIYNSILDTIINYVITEDFKDNLLKIYNYSETVIDTYNIEEYKLLSTSIKNNINYLISLAENIKTSYNNIYISRVGYLSYLEKYVDEYKDYDDDYMKIIKFSPIKDYYELILNTKDNINKNFVEIMTLIDNIIKAINKRKEEIRQETIKKEYEDNINQIKTTLNIYLDNLSLTKIKTERFNESITIFKNDIDNKKDIINNDSFNINVSSFYNIYESLLSLINNLTNVVDVNINKITEINNNIDNETDISILRLSLDNIDITKVEELINETTTKFNNFSKQYYILNYDIATIVENDETLKSNYSELYKSTINSYKTLIDNVVENMKKYYDETILSIKTEIDEKYSEINNEFNGENSTYNETIKAIDNIDDYMNKEQIQEYKLIYDNIQSEKNEFVSIYNTTTEIFDNYNNIVIPAIDKYISDFNNLYEELLLKTKFSDIENIYILATETYNNINVVYDDFTKKTFDDNLSSFNGYYLNILLNIKKLQNVYVLNIDDIIENKENIETYTKAGQIICMLYGHYKYGRYNETLPELETIKNYIYSLLNVNVFKALCSFSPILPLIWPTGITDIEIKINNNIEKNKVYNETTGTINYVGIYEDVIEPLLPEYFDVLSEYIAKAIIYSMNNIYDNETLLKYEDEYNNNQTTFYIYLLENEFKNITNNQAFANLCYKYFNYEKVWKVLTFVSGKSFNENLLIVPSNYPCTNYKSEIYESLVIILNRTFEHYGILEKSNGDLLKSDVNINNDDVIKGGACINYNDIIYNSSRNFYNGFDSNEFKLVSSLNCGNGIFNFSAYLDTENYVLNNETYKKFINPTRYYNIIFDNNNKTGVETNLKPFSIFNFYGVDYDNVSGITSFINNLYNEILTTYFPNLDKTNLKYLRNSLYYINIVSDLSAYSDYGIPFYSIVFKKIVGNISNWKMIIPFVETPNNPPYQTSKINTFFVNKFDTYIYENFNDI